ncbi:MAG: hypothetical protein ACRBB0_27125 [Pelagimonas sp.]|uniref:hypothetical protein n=1 Tax=Pelagimonas sp. TaxID=2073170 RepID=UPI003D6A5D63
MSKGWLTASIGPRTRKQFLLELIDQVPPEFFGREPMVVKTKEILINRIERARRWYWDDQQRAKPKTVRRNALCQITADECNAFLRSLPDVDHFGGKHE